MLPKKAIDEFKAIYEKEEGVKLSDSEATVRANNLMSLYQNMKNSFGVRTMSGCRNKMQLTHREDEL